MNFIFEVPNAIEGTICDDLISTFEKSKNLHGKGITSQGVDLSKKQSTEILIDYNLFLDKNWNNLLNSLSLGLNTGVEKYIKKYSVEKLIGIDSIASWSSEPCANIQRFLPGEGYKSWHCEIGNNNFSSRVLVWMLYLNDIDDGGTEFHFQDKIIKAEKGKLVIWPPYWTHFHRSQVSFTKTKYLITGWFKFD